jgi:uncharacterized protein YigA (DUF484 family)
VTFAAFVFVVVVIVVGLGALIAAVAAHRALRNVGQGLRQLDVRLAERKVAIPERLESTRVSLVNANELAERALWTLANADERMDKLRVDLTAKRDASDRLRVRLIEGQLSLARIREFVRLLMRLDKIRREFG